MAGHSQKVYSVRFSSDNKILASGSHDGTIKIWDASTNECLNSVQGCTNWVCSIALNSSGRVVASGGGDKMVKLWDIETGERIKVLQGDTKWKDDC